MERVVITVRMDDGEDVHRYTDAVPRVSDDVFARFVVDAQHVSRDGVTRHLEDGSVSIYPPHRIREILVSREPVETPG